MGIDQISVVDPILCVNRVYGLPVAVTRTHSLIVSGDKNAPEILIGEKKPMCWGWGGSVTTDASFNEVVSKVHYSFCLLLNSVLAKLSTMAVSIHVSRVATSWEVI
jgi:hypothetical protein